MSKETSQNTSSIVSTVWAFCQTLRDDGVGYCDYLVQLTYLLFLKMAHEYSLPPHNRKLNIPNKYNWESLLKVEALRQSILKKAFSGELM
jgi:type I restriction enzyme M protein